jgi:hypothetical protein
VKGGGTHCDGCGSYIKQQGYEKIKNKKSKFIIIIINFKFILKLKKIFNLINY